MKRKLRLKKETVRTLTGGAMGGVQGGGTWTVTVTVTLTIRDTGDSCPDGGTFPETISERFSKLAGPRCPWTTKAELA